MVAANSPTETAPPVDPRGPRPSSLIAAVAFLDGVSRIGTGQALSAWLARDVVVWGWAEPRHTVVEAGHPPFELWTPSDEEPLRALLREAAASVVRGLRSLREATGNEPLALALIERASVRRAANRRWEPFVSADKPLSELVLSLIVADMLERPGIYRERLAICKRCDRVSFQPTVTGRDGCLDHRRR